MAIFQVEYFVFAFQQEFHHIFHMDRPDAQAAAEDSGVDTVKNALNDLQATGTAIHEVRVRDPLVPRRTWRRRFPVDSNRTTLNPDVTEVCAVIDVRTLGDASTERRLRGLPDTRTNRNGSGQSILSQTFADQLIALEAALIDGDHGMRVIRPADLDSGDPDPETGWRDIDSVAADVGSGNTRTSLTTDEEHGFAKGDRVIIGGERECGVANLYGEWKVRKVIDANNFVIKRKYLPKVDPYNPEDLRVRKAVYTFEEISSLKFVKWATKQTGVTRTGPRGARSRRVCG